MFYAYVLFSEKDGRYYYGSTSDVESRIKSHNLGKVSSTKTRIPLKLVGYIQFGTRKEAMFQEKQFKRFKNGKYVLEVLQKYGAIV